MVVLDGRILPAGVTVILAIYLLHKNKKIFENPNKWDPDRFLPEEIEKRHPNSFVPFVTGPRTCLGLIRIFYSSHYLFCN